MKRCDIIRELQRIDNIEWMHNIMRNSDITIDLFDIKNERWFNVFCRDKKRDKIVFYGQSRKYPSGDVWNIEDIDTPILEQILKRLKFIENRGERLSFPESGNYFDRLERILNHQKY